MRIGFDAKRAFFNFRGLGNYTRDLIEGLVEIHPELELFLYTPVPKDARGALWCEKLGMKTKHPPIIRSPKAFSQKKLHSLWRSVFMSKDIKRDHLDIYHGTSHELPALTPKEGARQYKTVVTIHDLIFLRFPEFFPWIDRKVYLWKFKQACLNADKVLAICQQTRHDLIEFLGVPDSKINVIYQSCHPRYAERIGPESKEEVKKRYGLTGPFIINVGAIEERKNLLSLLVAMNILRKKIDHQLVIVGVGHGRYYKQVMEYINREGLGPLVKFLDYVPNEDMPALYQAADLFIFPSLFEGFGLPIVEAITSGVPVITSTGSCFPESGGPGPSYINPYSSEELAFEIEEVLGDEEKRKEMIRLGSEHALKFTREKTSGDIFSLYQSLLSNK